MRRKGLGTASIVAAEVGALGYFIPGEVHDILGLVSSDLLGSSSSERALFMMDRYDPDYVVITDENQYAPTGIVHQSRALQERYEPIHTVSRVFGDRYIAFARGSATYRGMASGVGHSITRS